MPPPTLPLLLLSLIFHSLHAEQVTFTPVDLTHKTFYGPPAVYLPQKCPPKLTFHSRARALPELPANKIGLLPGDISVNSHGCKAAVAALVFEPIGRPKQYAPQWTFEDSHKSGHPVNFTCGKEEFSIRFGYFNDVKTDNGFLDPKVVYLDFAVIPNTQPFGFCSYQTRRKDGGKPLDFVPFPTRKVWAALLKMIETGRKVPIPGEPQTPSITPGAYATPMPSWEVEL